MALSLVGTRCWHVVWVHTRRQTIKATWSPHPHTKQRLGLLIDVASFRDPDKQPPKASRGLSGCVCVPCYYLRVYFLIMNVCLGTSLRRLKDLENSVPNRGPLIQYVHNFIHIWIHVSYIQIYATNLYTVYMLR